MAIASLGAVACRRRVPDVGAFTPVLVEDGRIVELLMEADTLSDRDRVAAARNLREVTLPRARQNWETAGRIVVGHPRANALRADLLRLTGERAATIEAYVAALESGEPQALRDVVHRQAVLDQGMERLEADVQAATHAPADRGCSVARVR